MKTTPKPEKIPSRETAAVENTVFLALKKSRIYQDYKKAFTSSTGLPLRMRATISENSVPVLTPKTTEFCALMAGSSHTCAECFALQSELEEQAQVKPKTLKCFAGLCETAVPVRVGENLIAFLDTGQILLSRPDAAQFNKVAKTLVKLGTEIDLKKAEEAYFHIRVLTRHQYKSMVRLLTIFAEHLSACGQQLLLKAKAAEPPSVIQAKKWISDNSDEEMSLATVAHTVNMSAKYFSEMFHKAAGMTFVEYVGRVRVEKAKALLHNPDLRVCEIAFAVGFQSLSQFNRCFRKFAGLSPKAFRSKA